VVHGANANIMSSVW